MESKIIIKNKKAKELFKLIVDECIRYGCCTLSIHEMARKIQSPSVVYFLKVLIDLDLIESTNIKIGHKGGKEIRVK